MAGVGGTGEVVVERKDLPGEVGGEGMAVNGGTEVLALNRDYDTQRPLVVV